MRPRTLRFIISSSILAKIVCLIVLLPWVAPVFRPALIGIFGSAIAAQAWLLWRQFRTPVLRQKKGS